MRLATFSATTLLVASWPIDAHLPAVSGEASIPAVMGAPYRPPIAGTALFVGPLQRARAKPVDQEEWWPRALRPDLVQAVHRYHDFTERHFETGSGSRKLTFDYRRSRGSLNGNGPDHSQAVRRRSSWSATTGYSVTAPGGGTLRLAASEQVDRRKPLIAVENGHWLASRTKMATLSWQPDERFELGAAWFDVSSSKVRAAQDRNVMLAAGSPIAEHGFGLSASLKPRNDSRMRLGANLGAMSIDPRDVLALGARNNHDLRATVSLGFQFR